MRDHWLWKIQLGLADRGVAAEIRSVAHLRALYPNLPTPLDLKALEVLADGVAAADLDQWATVPPKNRKADRVKARATKISYEEIRKRRSKNESLQSIADAAGLSRERVRQICKKG